MHKCHFSCNGINVLKCGLFIQNSCLNGFFITVNALRTQRKGMKNGVVILMHLPKGRA